MNLPAEYSQVAYTNSDLAAANAPEGRVIHKLDTEPVITEATLHGDESVPAVINSDFGYHEPGDNTGTIYESTAVDLTTLDGVVPEAREMPKAVHSTGRVRRIGSWILHPASNYAASRITREQNLQERKGSILTTRVATEHGDAWETMDEQAQHAALLGAWAEMDHKQHRQLRAAARQQAWEEMTPKQRIGHRVEDIGLWGLTAAVAATIVLRSVPGAPGRIAEGLHSLLGGDPVAVPDLPPRPTTSTPAIEHIPPKPDTPPVKVVPDPEVTAPTFTQEQLGVTESMGLFEKFNDLGIDPSKHPKLLENIGDRLVDLGIAYRDDSIGGYGINKVNPLTGEPTVFSPDIAQWIISSSNELNR